MLMSNQRWQYRASFSSVDSARRLPCDLYGAPPAHICSCVILVFYPVRRLLTLSRENCEKTSLRFGTVILRAMIRVMINRRGSHRRLPPPCMACLLAAFLLIRAPAVSTVAFVSLPTSLSRVTNE
jgi:hypothetical protein